MTDYKEILIEYINNNTSRILSLIDRNKISKTYGCFDREYWHYKSKTFPNGMSNCYVYSLGLLYSTPFEENKFYKNPYVKELINGTINFVISSQHKDGSYDEHYYNEHSVAATSFILYHISKTILILSIDYKKYQTWIKKTSEFLINNEEYYTRSNHIACIISALYNIYLLTNDEFYRIYSEKFLEKLIKNFSKEGWFKEYRGCDPGYLTLTLYFLSEFSQKSNNLEIENILGQVIHLCSNFIHPDGSYGGFYGSRENQHFFPMGFEQIEVHNDIGRKLVNLFLLNLKNGNVEYMSDDRFSFFLFNNLLELSIELNSQRTNEIFKIENKIVFFKDAGLYINNNDIFNIIISLKKGGVIYLFKENRLIFRSCGIIGRTNKGIISSVGYENVKYITKDNEIKITGKFKKFNEKRSLKPGISILFNLFNYTLGRFNYFSKLMKKWVITSLILKEKPVDVNFTIEIKIQDNLELNYTIDKKKNIIFQEFFIAAYFPSVYVPSSRFYQNNDSLVKDILFKDKIYKLNKNNRVEFSLKL